MFRRTEVAHGAAGGEPDGAPPAGATPAGNFVVDHATPKLSGDLEDLLVNAPIFRTKVRGYDRLQVDNYVAWAEAEFRAARRETDDMVERYGRVCAELEISRRLLARSPEGQEMTVISERMGRMLRMAADEAAALSAAGHEEADQVLADARTEADARLRKAHEIKQLAVETSDRMREEARLMKAEATAELDRARAHAAETLREAEATATAELERARTHAAETLREAAAERQRLAEDAARARAQAEAELATWLADTRAAGRRELEEASAAAAATVAAAQSEVDELHRRRNLARESLLRLNEQLGAALETLAGVGELTAVARPAAG